MLPFLVLVSRLHWCRWCRYGWTKDRPLAWVDGQQTQAVARPPCLLVSPSTCQPTHHRSIVSTPSSLHACLLCCSWNLFTIHWLERCRPHQPGRRTTFLAPRTSFPTTTDGVVRSHLPGRQTVSVFNVHQRSCIVCFALGDSIGHAWIVVDRLCRNRRPHCRIGPLCFGRGRSCGCTRWPHKHYGGRGHTVNVDGRGSIGGLCLDSSGRWPSSFDTIVSFGRDGQTNNHEHDTNCNDQKKNTHFFEKKNNVRPNVRRRCCFAATPHNTIHSTRFSPTIDTGRCHSISRR